MPIDHEVINDGLVIVTAFGVVTGVELSDHVFGIVNMLGGSLNPGYKELFDATAVERIEFNEEDMKNISQIVLDHGQNRGNVTIAFVAIDEKVREMIGYYMKLCVVTDVTAKLFESREEAEEWLLSG